MSLPPSLPYESPEMPPALPFSDQRGSLKTLGVVMIVFGAFSGCMALMTPAAMFVPRPPGMPAPGMRELAGALLLYLVAATVLVSIGVGSLRLRRWSRPAAIVVAGTWAVSGIIGAITWLLFSPSAAQMVAATTAMSTPAATTIPTTGPTTAPAALSTTTVAAAGQMGIAVGGCFIVVFMIVLPAGMAIFYSRPSVRQTLDYFTPEPAWTDMTPTPVLAMSFWLALGSLFALNFVFWGVFPAFGRLLVGPPAIAALVAASAVLSILSVGMLRLSNATWWTTLLVVVLGATNMIVTYSRIDPLDLYRLSGSPPEQVELMQRMGVATRKVLLAPPLIYGIGLTAYLLWIRRYFRADNGPHLGRSGGSNALVN